MYNCTISVAELSEREGLVRLSEDIASSPLMHEIPSGIQIVFFVAFLLQFSMGIGSKNTCIIIYALIRVMEMFTQIYTKWSSDVV